MAGGQAGADGIRGGFQTERAANGRYQWQLKAPNGRIVAVSSAVYESPTEAARSFDELRRSAAELTARITHVRDGIGWIWVVPGPRGLPDARSNRAYERYATCQNAFRRFVALLGRQPEHDPDGRGQRWPATRHAPLAVPSTSLSQPPSPVSAPSPTTAPPDAGPATPAGPAGASSLRTSDDV
ncbi:YegP family protein [Kitasatospora sp. NPDC052896]|uniref:YegP family protein n=1 Tax=Kitasatospora sp. NPDC052896 TaxID=3364061 RepID=UPI0037C5968B